ncbi:MAG: ThiF family adenylyltransferase [Treponema sp.]|nr:ThiF family adenylyltransferase [Treponema sp.]
MWLTGVGKLGLADYDTAALSNLNRQFLHNVNDIGKFKTGSAKEKLCAFNDQIEITACNERKTEKNVKNIFSGYDIVLGAVDSFGTRFVINKACVSLRMPYINRGINGFSGCTDVVF